MPAESRVSLNIHKFILDIMLDLHAPNIAAWHGPPPWHRGSGNNAIKRIECDAGGKFREVQHDARQLPTSEGDDVVRCRREYCWTHGDDALREHSVSRTPGLSFGSDPMEAGYSENTSLNVSSAAVSDADADGLD